MLRWAPALVLLASPSLALAEPLLRAGARLTEPLGVASRAEYALELEDRFALPRARTLLLDLPEGPLVAEREAVQRQRDGFFWLGRIAGGREVMITVHRGMVSGLLYTPWRTYEIRPGPGPARLVELDTARFEPCDVDVGDHAHGVGGDGAAEDVAPSANALPPTSSMTGGPVIEMLVLYTPQARDRVGGVPQIESLIQSAINASNTSYGNSQISARLQLIHTELAPLSDSGSSSTDLNSLRNSATVQALRTQWGADLVSMVVDANGSCGRGYVQRNPGPGFENNGYSVVADHCAVGNLSFAHEVGHNQGCEHDPANGTAPANASFPFAYGHFHSGQYRTVMSYSTECTGGCARAPHLSNSSIFRNGLVTGILDARENYRVINNTAAIVAAFRPPASRLELAQTEYTVREAAGSVTVRVDRIGPLGVAISARLITRSVTATATQDYQSLDADLGWAANDATSRDVVITIVDDLQVEEVETFEVVLTDVVGAGQARTVAEVTIEDFENGLIEVVPPATPPREIDGNLVVEVRRVAGALGAVDVDFTTQGVSATNGLDFSAVGGRLSWADGESTAKPVTIPVRDDGLVEGPETLQLVLSNVTGGATVEQERTDLVIADWEEGFVSFVARAHEVVENEGLVVLQLQRETGTSGRIEAQVAVSTLAGGAESGLDFAPIDGLVVFDAGVASATVAIPIIDDLELEGDEPFVAFITSVSGGARISEPREAEILIRDYEQGQLRFEIDATTFPEDAGAIALSIVRAEGSSGPASARYAIRSRTATLRQDVLGVGSGDLTWEDGDDTPRVIEMQLVDDALIEGPETFVVELADVQGATAPDPSSLELTIQDREPGAVTVEATTVRVAEDAGSVEVEIARVDGTQDDVELPWRVIGAGAEHGTDFEAVRGTLRWSDGEQGPQTISIQILDDDRPEPDEVLELRLGPVVGRAALPEPLVQIVIEDTGGGALGFVDPPSTVPELAGAVTFEVERTGETNGDLEVSVLGRPDSAEAGADFEALETTLRWADGEDGPREVTLTVLDDAEEEPAETLVIELRTDRADVEIPAEITVTIEDDDEGGCTCVGTSNLGGPELGGLLLCGLLLLGRRRRAA